MNVIKNDEQAGSVAASPKHVVVEAVFDDGVIKPRVPLDLPSGTRVRLQLAVRLTATVTPQPTAHPPVHPDLPTDAQRQNGNGATVQHLTMPAPPPSAALVTGMRELVSETWRRWEMGRLAERQSMVLFAFGLFIYVITRLWALPQFPIYFFSDEAIQTVLAEELLRRGLRDAQGNFLPPYFQNAEKWNLSLSVYLHMVGLALFGKSEWVTRGVSAVISILPAVSIGLMLKLIFNQRWWWVGPLVLSMAPAWFLHSRTAFETVMMVSFYAGCLLLYLLYRYRSPHFLHGAVVLGAMTFYSYANGPGVMLVSVVLLLLSDWRYHWQQRRTVLRSVGLAVLLAIPFVRFRYLQPDALATQSQALFSYWLDPIPLSDKLARLGRTYLSGFSPYYWFVPNEAGIERHRMKGMGNLPTGFLPFFLIGLVVCLRNWRSSAHRAMVIAMLAAPFAAAFVEIGITRVLSFVVPASVLIALGLEQSYRWVARRIPYRPTAIVVAGVLAALSLGMLRTALVDGPTWYSDYGLGGMQYGAPQIFRAVPRFLRESPETRILLSPTWANNPNVYAPFYLSPEEQGRVEFINIDAFLYEKQPLDRTWLFVMPADEYERAQESGKFVLDEPEHVIPYPDGRPGFYFVRMEYVPHIDELLEADKQARAQLVPSVATIDEQTVDVQHSLLDTGQAQDLFDGDPRTLIRGMEANPLVVELSFAEPRIVSAIGMDFGSMALFEISVNWTREDGTTERSSQRYEGLPNDPHVDIALPDGPHLLTALRIEVADLQAGEPAHIHVREIELR